MVTSSEIARKSTSTRMPISSASNSALLDVRHHPRALVELDDGRHVRHPIGERRQVVLPHDRERVHLSLPGRFLPRDVGLQHFGQNGRG